MAYSLHLDQKFCFYSSRCFVFIVRSTSTHRVNLVNKNHWWFLWPGHCKKLLYQFLTFTHILAHHIWRRDRKERALSLSCASFCQVSLSSTWWSIEQDPSPWLSAAFEDLRESERHDDSLFECIFGVFQSRNVFPMNIRLLSNDSFIDLPSELILFLVVSAASGSSIFLTTCGFIVVSNI